jgi:uridine kinase|tara:strand:- start:6660 stop:7262 length:603 start_codon:yes stop_codon:yes gene_type:complete
VIIGISGGTGAGKTTLVNFFAEIFGKDQTLIISQDRYYKHLPELSFEERCLINFDHPDTLDFDLLLSHVLQLQEGKSIQSPLYSFEQHLRKDEIEVLHPKKYILIEGILVFAHAPLRNLFNHKVYIEADINNRIKRRMERDLKTRGRTKEEVTVRFQNTLQDMHKKFISPHMNSSDIIIINNDLKFAKNQIQEWIEILIK